MLAMAAPAEHLGMEPAGGRGRRRCRRGGAPVAHRACAGGASTGSRGGRDRGKPVLEQWLDAAAEEREREERAATKRRSKARAPGAATEPVGARLSLVPWSQRSQSVRASPGGSRSSWGASLGAGNLRFLAFPVHFELFSGLPYGGVLQGELSVSTCCTTSTRSFGARFR